MGVLSSSRSDRLSSRSTRLATGSAGPLGTEQIERAGRTTNVLALVSAAALCGAVALSPGDATNGPVVCPFRLATGLPCPGCGMTRAWVFLAHGRIGDAVSANPFALVTMPAALLLAVLAVLALVRRRPAPEIGRVLGHPAAKVLLAAWVVFGAVRAVAVATGHASA